jgi:hypothetical protein
LTLSILFQLVCGFALCNVYPRKEGSRLLRMTKMRNFYFFFGLKDEKIQTRTVIEWRICIYGLQKTEQRR